MSRKRKAKKEKKKQICILIDTNIYLDYFSMSSATITSLMKLLGLLKKRRLKLILIKQIKDEYIRNKKRVIYETRNEILKQISRRLKSIQLPPPIRYSKEAKAVRKSISELGKNLKELLKKYDEEFEKKTDIEKLIESIFRKAEYAEENDAIIQRAYTRYLKGNPPIKRDSYGDAIIWETVLDKFSNNDLIIVTNDKDWYSTYDKKFLNELLLSEWKKKTKCKIKISSSLADSINPFLAMKAKIKKEIVDEEKASKPYLPSGYVTVSGLNDSIAVYPSAFPPGMLGTNIRYPGLNISPGFGFRGNVESPYINPWPTSQYRYRCPNCHYDITEEVNKKIREKNLLETLIIDDETEKIKCSNCGKEFDYGDVKMGY